MMQAHVGRILIIRLHAIGDTAITLPSCSALALQFPEYSIEYLTTASAAPLIHSLDCFHQVYLFPDCTNRSERVRGVASTAVTLRDRRYTMVIDLQGNWVSRMLRRLLAPAAWSEFDRSAPLPAGLRVRRAFAAAGFPDLDPPSPLPVKPHLLLRAQQMLAGAGWDGRAKLVLLNPAGFWESRHWPDRYFATLAQNLLKAHDCRILFLGTDRIRHRVSSIQAGSDSRGIDLVGQTTLEEAFAIVQHASLTVSEDSGLMHMSWISGIPTIALFGSTRHDWAAPLGPHTRHFHSGDLSCSACMSPECRYGDVHCLTRVTPISVLNCIESLLESGVASRR